MYSDGGPSKQIHWDTDLSGFGVRLYPSGVRSYVLQYGPETRCKLMVLGRVGAVTLDQARVLARENLHLIATDVDPLAARKHKRRARADAITVEGLAEEYLSTENQDNWSESHAADSKRRLRGAVAEAFGQMIARDVSRAEINRLHAKLAKGGAPVEANTESHPNPASRRRGSSIGRNPEASGSRYPTLEEAPKLLAAADSKGHGVAVRLWLLTGLRHSELIHRRWSDVDFRRRKPTVPNTKNRHTRGPAFWQGRRAAQVPPTPPQSACTDLPEPMEEGPLSDFRNRWKDVREASGLHDLRVHDLRRTVGTWLTALVGVPISTVSALLNHRPVGAGITAIYARPMDEALREAFNELERLLASLNPGRTRRKLDVAKDSVDRSRRRFLELGFEIDSKFLTSLFLPIMTSSLKDPDQATKGRASIESAADLYSLLGELVDGGCLRVHHPDRDGPGRPASPVIELHPGLDGHPQIPTNPKVRVLRPSVGILGILGMPIRVVVGVRVVTRRSPTHASSVGSASSISMLAILLALLQRIGAAPAIIPLTLYALPPIMRNTLAGLEAVSPEVVEAARGIGMCPRQRRWLVELPLSGRPQHLKGVTLDRRRTIPHWNAAMQPSTINASVAAGTAPRRISSVLDRASPQSYRSLNVYRSRP